MGNENLMRAAEIEKQANNAQKEAMREKREKLDQVKRMYRDADNIKNQALMFKSGASVAPGNDPKRRMASFTAAKQREAKANDLKARAKELEKQMMKSTSDKDFKIKEMYDAARKLRTEA